MAGACQGTRKGYPYHDMAGPAKLTFPWNSWLLIAVMVALWVLFSRPGSREQAGARPKEDSPADFDSFQEPRGYRG